jgi:PAS domain S-box-containing protein
VAVRSSDRVPDPRRARASLLVRLPLLVAAVLLPIVVAFLWIADHQLQRVAIATGGERAQATADQIAQLMAQNSARGLTELQRVATADVVRRVLTDPSDANRQAALRVLRPLVPKGQPAARLLDADGRTVLSIAAPEEPAGEPTVPLGPGLPEAGVGPFVDVHGSLYFTVAVNVTSDPVSGGDASTAAPARIGSFVLTRQLGEAQSSQLIGRLVGSGALVAIGNTGGGVWTDFTNLIPRPKADTGRRGVSEYTSAEGEGRFGAAAPIAGTPWAVVVDFPRSTFLVPIQRAVGELGVVALLFVALAVGVVALLASRAEALHEELGGQVQQRTERLEATMKDLDHFFLVSLDLLCIAGFDGRFQRVNPAWRDVLGWEPDELTAAPFMDFVHPDDREATTKEMGRLSEGLKVLDFENRYRHRDGSYRWLHWVSAPVLEEGKIYAAARDVTAERKMTEDLKVSLAKVGEVNRELESFSYSVSHDLRAPLRHITGFAALLERSAGDRLDDKDRRYLGTIVNAATRMGRLIDDLLAFSRTSRAAISRQPVDLAQVVDEARRDIEDETAGRDLDWVVEPLPPVSGDREMLKLAFVNLLSNAVKYSRPRERARIEVGAAKVNGSVTVFVRDNGVGFDPQYAHKLFGVFQRLHSADDFEGTGIGLATVRRIVSRHGGKVWAEGVPGRGATFYLSLPPAAREGAA